MYFFLIEKYNVNCIETDIFFKRRKMTLNNLFAVAQGFIFSCTKCRLNLLEE